eukprot:15101129-Alexandrium_andersonii.AAC.1
MQGMMQQLSAVSGTLQTFSEGISGIRDEVASQKLRAEQLVQRQEAENSRMQGQIDALTAQLQLLTAGHAPHGSNATPGAEGT